MLLLDDASVETRLVSIYPGSEKWPMAQKMQQDTEQHQKKTLVESVSCECGKTARTWWSCQRMSQPIIHRPVK